MKRRNRNSDPSLWASLEEVAESDGFEQWFDTEFPSLAGRVSGPRRRDVLKWMGASLLLANASGCQQDTTGAAVPFVRQPEGEAPDIPQHFATAVPFCGFAQPVLVTASNGHPTKLDGNPDHPVAHGASDIFMQAAILELYDPDRSKGPVRNGAPSNWSIFASEIERWRRDWIEAKGDGLRILMGETTSPTLIRQLRECLTDFPAAKIHIFEPARHSNEWTREVFGRRLDPHFELGRCDVVVSLDHDLLGPGLHQVFHAARWARQRGAAESRLRLHVAEPSPTITGSMGTSRLPASAAEIGQIAQAMGARLGAANGAELPGDQKSWVAAVCDELKAHAGRSLVTAGPSQPAAAHVLVAKINEALGNTGKTIWYSDPVAFDDPGLGTIRDLAADAKAGNVKTLICLDTNPVYAAEGDLDFRESLARIERRIHIGLFRDETAEMCEWHLPLTHAFESWSDLRSLDGRTSFIQPITLPLYDGRTAHQILELLSGKTMPDASEPVRGTWQQRFGQNFEKKWKKALRDGFIEDTAAKPIEAKADGASATIQQDETGEFEIIFRPDATVWDGRFANNGWLQETPKPLLTTTWGNVLAISPQLAREQKLENGDQVEIRVGRRSVVAPIWILPGQAPKTLTAFLGGGRTHAGALGNGQGYNAYAIRPARLRWSASATLRKTGNNETLAITQLHHRMEGFDLVREVTDEAPALKEPSAVASLYPEPEWADHAWAMAIDLDLCIGCNACVAACTAENNVPVVGKDEVIRGREMHWIRIARYYSGKAENPRSFFQPVPCMHCEEAPCEMGCPVHATVHTPEGLNAMVYNRCIGTRTCSSYCPYKVRRFNWYDYRAASPSPLHLPHNPDVTVRARGVMEKCTYCTQRIEAARARADIENRRIRRDEIVTACQAACPTTAIIFGDLNDADSAISKRRRDGRHYTLLEDLGTRPRTTYLARWRDDFGPASKEPKS